MADLQETFAVVGLTGQGSAPDVQELPVLMSGITATGGNKQTLIVKSGSTSPTASDPAAVVSVSPNSLIPSTQDRSGSGSINALNGTVTATTNGCSTVVFSVSGTFVANYFFKGIKQDGTEVYLYGNKIDFGVDQEFQNYSASPATFVVDCSGCSSVSLKAESYTSGTINVGWNASVGVGRVKVYQPTAASLQSTARLNDGIGNSITSSSFNAGTNLKQAVDVYTIQPSIGYYTTSFALRQSAASAANVTVFSMRNAAASTKTVYIERMFFTMSFNATTPVGRTAQTYLIQRFSAATPTAGTALTAGQSDSDDPASQVTDIRFLDTGLTTTGVTFDTKNLGTIYCPSFGTVTTQYIRERSAIKLKPGEGLCIRLGVAAVVGQELSGEIIWSER